MRGRALAGAAAAVALLAGACSDDDDGNGATATTAPAPTTAAPDGSTTSAAPPPELEAVSLALREIAVLDQPVALASRPGTPDLYVAERGGRVRRIDVDLPQDEESSRAPRYSVQSRPFLDLSGDVITDGNEQGLLGLAFSSDGRTLYVHFSAAPDGDTRLVEYVVGDREDLDESTRRELLAIEQPARNHNGGQLAIGPDGYLYVALGDGGGAGDPDGNAQDPETLLGKILRIDPEGAAPGQGSPPYAVPAGNPFSGGGGRPEIWLFGARNPWRFSFDSDSGDLWVADVGQNQWEEINHLAASGGVDAGKGVNLGWDRMEGVHEFEGENPPGAVLPVHEYSQDDGGCSVIGGYVYRGDALAGLAGAYLYADYCLPGIDGIAIQGGEVVAQRHWDLPGDQITSFGQGEDGELYVLSQSGPVWKLVPPG